MNIDVKTKFTPIRGMLTQLLHSIFKPKAPTPLNGYRAYHAGFQLKDNPYPRHTFDHSIWRDDWLEESRWTKPHGW